MLKINTLPGTGIRAILYCWHWWIDKLHLLPCIYKTGVQLHLKIKYCNCTFFTMEMKKFSLLSECSTVHNCCYFGFVAWIALRLFLGTPHAKAITLRRGQTEGEGFFNVAI